MKKNYFTLGVFISTAFDTVDHDILIKKLNQHGVKGNNILHWLKSYLHDCKQYITFLNKCTAFENTTCGIQFPTDDQKFGMTF